MRKIILNEKELAEKIISEGNVYINIPFTANLLCRYLYHEKGMRKVKICEEVNNFLMDSEEEYDKDYWDSLIEKYSTKAKKYPLVNIGNIKIYQSDMRVLSTLKLDESKVFFTCIILARYYEDAFQKDEGWVNTDPDDLYELSNLSGGKKKIYSVLFSLKEKQLITYSKKVNNTNFKIEYEPVNFNIVSEVTDIEDLGFQYERILNDKLIYRCKCCNRLTKLKVPRKRGAKQNIRKKQYCEKCGKLKEKERYIRYNKKRKENTTTIKTP